MQRFVSVRPLPFLAALTVRFYDAGGGSEVPPGGGGRTAPAAVRRFVLLRKEGSGRSCADTTHLQRAKATLATLTSATTNLPIARADQKQHGYVGKDHAGHDAHSPRSAHTRRRDRGRRGWTNEQRQPTERTRMLEDSLKAVSLSRHRSQV